MKIRSLASLGALMAAIVVGLSQVPAAGQAGGAATAPAGKYKVPRTSWGHPDLQGVWNNTVSTPLERPKRFKDKQYLTDEELAAFYRSLFESEARHHSTYVRLAYDFMPEDAVRDRLRTLAAAEAAIIDRGDPVARMHS